MNNTTDMIYLRSYMESKSIMSSDISVITNDGINKSNDMLCVIKWCHIDYTAYDIYDIRCDVI